MDIKKCPHCHHDISSASWTIHESYCERHNYYCNKCDKVVHKSDRDSHQDQFHKPVACDLCGEKVTRPNLPDHQYECPNRLVECMFCELGFQFRKLPKHEEICGSRTEKCESCDKRVQYRHQAHHVCEKPPVTQVNEELIICPYCLEPAQDYILLQEHIFNEHIDLIGE